MVDYLKKTLETIQKNKAEGINCGGDVVGFSVPNVGEVTARDTDFETGFDKLEIMPKGGEVISYERKNYPAQFKSLDDYFGKECSGGREVVVPSGLGKKRERKVQPLTTLDPEAAKAQDVRDAYRKEQLPEQAQYNKLLDQVRAINQLSCNGKDACDVLAAKMQREVIKPLGELQTAIEAQLLKSISEDANGFTAQDKENLKVYGELSSDIQSRLIQLEEWKRLLEAGSRASLFSD
ncbi:MAG: hypothetical protein HYT75_07615 [Deltaproteobacteria bacterium]|nr:hypothetical protein [Deltaproteobacteria bacterium]